MLSDADCIVVGGGVAGVAAAVAATERGWRTIVLERGRVLGGMARSLTVRSSPSIGDVPEADPSGEIEELDCGQHVILACCSEYRHLLRRLGTHHLVPVQPRLKVTIVDEHGRRGQLAEQRLLPAPFHLVNSAVRLPFLRPSDHLALSSAGLRLLRLRGVEGLDRESFATWLGEAASTPDRVAFWNLVCVATCNLPVDRLSAAIGAFVLREGFLLKRGAAAVGVPRTPLSRLLEPVTPLVRSRGGRVELDSAAAELLLDDDAVRGIRTASGAELRASRVVLAGPPTLIEKLAPAQAPTAGQLTTSPICNLHLHFDRTVLDEPFLAVWNSPLQWLFSRTQLRNEKTAGETITCSLSAADELVDLPAEAIVERLLPHFHRAQPRSRKARLLSHRVTRERHATAALTPGSNTHRSGSATTIRGLALAGAWTATGWPITMESAARSGRAAITAVS